MPEDLPPIVPPSTPRTPRSPVPGWMWGVFGLAMIPVCALLCIAGAGGHPDQMGGAGFAGGVIGFFLGLPMVGGLALAARLVNGDAGRAILGVVFAFLFVILICGVAFAGCMCVLQTSRS